MAPLEGVRVLDRTGGIAGPYCSKLLRDAGADVVKVEPPGGDPMRAWRSGALFDFLHGGKRSVADDAHLLAGADLLLTGSPPDLEDLWRRSPRLVVVSITPFGVDGPWADRPATELTLQAACGSVGSRGLPDGPPLVAGAEIGAWMTGSYAAVAALAALRLGRSTHVDVAQLDCMAVSLVTHPSAFAEFLGWPPLAGTGRTVEVPSVAPTSDGWVVLTTNSATQFQDFLVMIGRSDWLADPDLPNVTKRFERRDEFLTAVFAYTSKRTTAEVLEEASAFRIPAGPVLDGSSIATFEQFEACASFEPSPHGGYPQPRPPYRIRGNGGLAPAPAPAPAADDVDWPVRAGEGVRGERARPLDGIRVLDLTAWWAGPAATHVLAALGADVVKVESPARPDLMRYSSVRPPTEDRWWEWGPLFHAVNTGKRAVTLDLTDAAGKDAFERLVRTADLVVENFTPRVLDQFGLGEDRLAELDPTVILLRMPAFGLDGPWRDRTGFAQTMECITGLATRTGEADGPPVLLRGACDPLAGMHAVFAALLALRVREHDGAGGLVESIMVEAGLNAAAEAIVEHGRAGTILRRTGNRGDGAAPQNVYPCAGEDRWVAISVPDDERWAALRRVLGDPPWAASPALASAGGRHQHHGRIDGHLAAWCGTRDPEEVVDALVGAGVPAEVVIPGREIARNPQLRHRGLFEVEDHPLTGRHELAGMPFRFSGIDRWVRRPAPTLGEHNREVLGEVLTAEEIDGLYERGVAGERVRGA